MAEDGRRHAAALAEAAAVEARRARNFELGALAEERTASLLDELITYGFRCLHDRAWPGTRSANIDHIVVGPSGVFVVDTKNWSGDVRIEGGRLYRGDALCDDDLEKVQAQADALRIALASTGLPPIHVHAVCALHGRDLPKTIVGNVWVIGAETLPRALLRYNRALTEGQIDEVLDGLRLAAPAATGPSSAPVPIPAQASAALPAIEEILQPTLFTTDDLEEDALEAALQKPFADWMTFLHPAQARFVVRDTRGAARITGGAGTGKTVVALHRLAHLSRGRANRLLYVTFVRTVPRVLKHAFARLSPETADRVEFSSLHAWAVRFLRDRRLPHKVDQRACDNAFARAWSRLPERHTLERSAPYSYWREEVDTVLRGRDVRSLDDYLVLERVGRGSRLGHVQRGIVWRLAQSYAANLASSRLIDWNDVLRLARDEARRLPPEPTYDAVVLDEAQDMPLLAGQLLVAIAPEGGLLFVGDDGQRVFPGGFRLSECGVDVTGGRSVRFTRNYRNTREIYEFAATLLSGEYAGVLDDLAIGQDTSAQRSGGRPVVVRAGSTADHDTALLTHLAGADRSAMGSIAVLTERIATVNHLLRLLAHHRIPASALEDWDGAPYDGVLVGTAKRAKGLEFSSIYVTHAEPNLLDPDASGLEDSALEQWQRRRRELYVAMTRARDVLWVGVLDPAVTSAAAPLAADPTPDDAVEGTVHELMRAVLGAEPTGGPARFRQSGWAYEGTHVGLSCATCASALHVCRKPYESAGRSYRFWALTCPTCLTSVTPDELPPDTQKLLRKLG
ncbi:MAG TPA: NERD domain-containing protein [Nocardioidaceae bacterium]